MNGIWGELGISGGTTLIILIALYFVVKWAVKNGIEEAYEEAIRKDLDKRSSTGHDDNNLGG